MSDMSVLVLDIAYLVGAVIGIGLMAFLMAGAVWLVCLILRRRLTRSQFLSVFATSFVICLVFSLIGRFA